MSIDGFVTDVRALHAGSRCVQIDLIDVETGRVVLTDLADAERADERALLMCDFAVARAGGEA